MSPSLSWIDDDALASSLERAGISTLPERAEPARVRFYDPPTLPSAPPPRADAPYAARPPAGPVDTVSRPPVRAPAETADAAPPPRFPAGYEPPAPVGFEAPRYEAPTGTEDTAPTPHRRRPAPSDVTTVPDRADDVRPWDATPLASTAEVAFNEVTVSSPAAVEPDLSAPAVSARVAALAAWLQEAVGDRFYIADPEGLAIFATKGVEELVVSGVALERAIRSLRGITGAPNVGAATLELDADRLLDTIWCDTPVGRVAVGVVGATKLSKAQIATIRGYIARVFDWKES